MVMLVSSSTVELDARRRALGMSHRVLARRAGVSEPTVKRVLSGKGPDTSHRHFEAIAAALGLTMRLEGEDELVLRQRAAQRKAEWLVRQVQGTSGLEAQGVDVATLSAMVEQTYHELMAGPARRIWEE